MLNLKKALLDSLIERLVFLAAHEECEAIQRAYLKFLRKTEAMRASVSRAHSANAYSGSANVVLG